MKAEGTFYFDVSTLSKLRASPHHQQVALSTGRKGRGTQDPGQSLQDTCGLLPNALSTGALPHPLHQIWTKDLLKPPKAPAPSPQPPQPTSIGWHWGLGGAKARSLQSFIFSCFSKHILLTPKTAKAKLLKY